MEEHDGMLFSAHISHESPIRPLILRISSLRQMLNRAIHQNSLEANVDFIFSPSFRVVLTSQILPQLVVQESQLSLPANLQIKILEQKQVAIESEIASFPGLSITEPLHKLPLFNICSPLQTLHTISLHTTP